MTEGPPPVPRSHVHPAAPFPPPGPHAAPGSYGPPGTYGPPAPPSPRGGRSRRGLWIGLGAALLVLVLCAGAAFGARGHLADWVGTTTGADGEHDETTEIDSLLAGHTRALKERDLAAFVAPFDAADADLVARQTSLFHNLVKLPLAESRYERLTRSAARPAGAGTTFDLTVSFVHQLDGYDLAPVAELYTWTVVRTGEDAPLKVTAVGGLAQDRARGGVAYYPAPWDKWRSVHVERTPHTLLIVDGSLRAQAQRYAPLAEQAAVDDLAAWRAGGVTAEIPKGFVISMVKGKKELGSLYRSTTQTPAESGLSIAVPPHGSIDGADGAGPGVGGSRVVIDVTDRYYFTEGGRDRQLKLFRHELAHSLVNSLTERGPDAAAGDEQEKWVVEGFAEYLGYGRKPWPTSERTASSRAILRSLDGDPALPTNATWNSPGRAGHHYWLGHSAIGYIAERYGERKLFQFVAAHYRGARVGAATREVLGVSYADFADAWGGYVTARVG
ncbi:hypothetical protein [Micromonospora sp. NPDC047074]|uniref:hypothetical protein n=1 Tax=Micromonospora sp. NPDC047074 TaxID=3154339 RepID=UPI0033F09014